MSGTIPAIESAPATDAPRVIRRTGFGRFGRVRAVGPLGVIAAIVCVLLAVVAVFAPLLARYDPEAVDVVNVYGAPSGAHLLGTDDTGRDLLSRLIYGARPSLSGPLLVIVLSATLGTALGVLAAWRRGVVDSLLSRLFDLLFAFPGIVLAIIATTIFGTGFLAPVIALSISYVPVVGRVMRAAAARERSLPYIEALQVQGLSPMRICVRHLVPHIAPLLFVQCTVGFGYALLDLAAISFLGLGIQPPSPDWGVMVANGKPSILGGYPQQSLYAGLVIVVAVVAVNLLGERLAQRFEIADQT